MQKGLLLWSEGSWKDSKAKDEKTERLNKVFKLFCNPNDEEFIVIIKNGIFNTKIFINIWDF